MAQTYTNRSNTARAARKTLGATAKQGIDYTVEGGEGAFTWAPIQPAEGAVAPPPEPVDEFRVTPAGEATVADLVPVGCLIGTNYGTGGRVVTVSRAIYNDLSGRDLEHFTICYVPAECYGSHRASDVRILNQYVAVGGRILKLFASNADEVTVEGPAIAPSVSVPAVEGVFPEEATGTLDCPVKARTLDRVAKGLLVTGADTGLISDAFVIALRAALDGAYEAGYSAAALAAKPARRVKAPRPARGASKRDLVADLLKRPEGCTNREILDATGWPSVSVPAAAKAAKLSLRTERVAGQPNRYYGEAVPA